MKLVAKSALLAVILCTAICVFGRTALKISNIPDLPDPSAAARQQAAPEALVDDLYRFHAQDFKAERDRILDGKSRRFVDKYFDKNLADLIWKDLTTHRDEVGVLDFDPFYNAQDAKITGLHVGRAIVKGDKATVPVSFSNYGTKQALTYRLAKENGGWKITDIGYSDGSSLLKYFREAN